MITMEIRLSNQSFADLYKKAVTAGKCFPAVGIYSRIQNCLPLAWIRELKRGARTSHHVRSYYRAPDLFPFPSAGVRFLKMSK